VTDLVNTNYPLRDFSKKAESTLDQGPRDFALIPEEDSYQLEALKAANIILLQQNKYSVADHEAMDILQAAIARAGRE
jgi:hypothetical protein